jgi:MerR family transcriptional regulator/heat shock protein HspR
MDERTPVYVISVAAELAGMHPQTLRTYDRLGIVSPSRAGGRGRRYSQTDVLRLREVQRLSQQEGVNLEGIRRILELADEVSLAQQEVLRLRAELQRVRGQAARDLRDATVVQRGEIVPVRRPGQAVVVWQRRRAQNT